MKIRTKVRAESRDILIEQRAIFPWTFVVSLTNGVISLARTWNFSRHSTILQQPSCELLYVIDTFKWSCNLHKIYCLLFKTAPWIEAYNLQIVCINRLPDKTCSYTVKGFTIFAKSFKTSLLTLSWDMVLPTHKTNTYHFHKVGKLCLFHIKTKTSAVLCVKSAKANWHQWSDKAQILKREGLLWMLSQRCTFE